MGEQHDVLEPEQRRVHDRLTLVDVEAGSRDRPLGERDRECLLVDDRAACRVDEEGRRLHACERLGVDQPARLGRERTVQRDDVGAREQLLERQIARAELRLDRLVGAAAAAVGDLHAEGGAAAGDGASDLAEADDAEQLPLQAAAEQEEHVP